MEGGKPLLKKSRKARGGILARNTGKLSYRSLEGQDKEKHEKRKEVRASKEDGN